MKSFDFGIFNSFIVLSLGHRWEEILYYCFFLKFFYFFEFIAMLLAPESAAINQV